MSFKTKIIFAIMGVFLMVACSVDDNETNGYFSTRQETNASTNAPDTLAPDETGANPVVSFYSVDESDTVRLTEGESQTVQAPLLIELNAHIGNPDGYKYICEWRVWSTKDNGSEDSPLVTRFEEKTTYTLTKSGGYGIKLYITFTQGTDTIEYESEVINVVISESKLTCPDGFSPNNDSINDTYRITAQSIVKLDAKFFDRWGEKIHTATLETAKHVEGEPNKLILWDGKRNGKVVENGVYYLNIDALGSDGVKYKFKKAVTVMKGFREGTENGESGGSGS